LERLSLCGNERVVDAGCGTGRLTAALLARLPQGQLLAIDRSWNMLLTARANLRPDFGAQVKFARVELPSLPLSDWADLVFSTATFHWVRDHQTLFDNIFRALRPGGRLFAQCGGGPNLVRARALAEDLMQRQPFASYFSDWGAIWEYSTPEITAARLQRAGFADIATSLEEASTTLANEESYREFVTSVIFHAHLARLPEGSLRGEFIDTISARAAREDPPFTLDYWRLNIQGRRP
jgi:trans-aconitate methyltransferase